MTFWRRLLIVDLGRLMIDTPRWPRNLEVIDPISSPAILPRGLMTRTIKLAIVFLLVTVWSSGTVVAQPRPAQKTAPLHVYKGPT